MSAERLREAADLVRVKAETAGKLDWFASEWLSSVGFSSATVALAVADWLSAADEYYGHDTLTDRAALAAADAILAGGAS